METLGTIPLSSFPGVTGGLGVEMAFPERTVVTLVRIVFKSYFFPLHSVQTFWLEFVEMWWWGMQDCLVQGRNSVI